MAFRKCYTPGSHETIFLSLSLVQHFKRTSSSINTTNEETILNKKKDRNKRTCLQIKAQQKPVIHGIYIPFFQWQMTALSLRQKSHSLIGSFGHGTRRIDRPVPGVHIRIDFCPNSGDRKQQVVGNKKNLFFLFF